jgi:alkylation response protein AidB-like acyl-CoA dehydrogenase
LAQGKRHSVTNTPLRERAVAQLRIAEAEATVQAARAFFYEAVQGAWVAACDGRDMSLRERATFRIACVHAAQASAAAVDKVFSISGSSAIQASVPVERCWRDVHTAATHVTINESNYEAAGRVLFGMEPGIAIL